jgi:hypothetical protein
MFNHEPDGYHCPFCRLSAGGEDDLTKQATSCCVMSTRWRCRLAVVAEQRRPCPGCAYCASQESVRPATRVRSRSARRRTRDANRHPEHLRLRRHIYPPAQRISRVPGCVALPRACFLAVRRRQPLCDSTSRSTGDCRRPRALRTDSPSTSQHGHNGRAMPSAQTAVAVRSHARRAPGVVHDRRPQPSAPAAPCSPRSPPAAFRAGRSM